MHTYVVFRHPEPFVAISDSDCILSTSGARWFVTLLERLPEIEVSPGLCQEDWGVVAFTARRGCRFWIGLSAWLDEDKAWLAHFHHGSFAWIQRLRPSGKRELQQLIVDFHAMLVSDPEIEVIAWYREHALLKADAVASPTPEPT